VPGKTRFRDVLCDRIDISQLEAEELVDDMERSGRIRFIGVAEGRGWQIQQGAGVR
jgi:aryl-alcohol dehydrogenase-like predicted oxidoreductase